MNTDILFQNSLWILPITLTILALIQFLYWFFLNNSVPSEKKSQVSTVTSPVMPTYPDNLVDRAQGGTGGGVTREPQPETTALGDVIPKMVMLNHPKGRKEINLPNTPSYGMGRFYNREYNILIALDERSISRRHAVLSQDASSNQYFLTDTNSSYGTAIQRGETFAPITPGEEERIYHNDIIQFGRSLTVQYTLPGPTRQSVMGGM
jgi:hypothetical protein